MKTMQANEGQVELARIWWTPKTGTMSPAEVIHGDPRAAQS